MNRRELLTCVAVTTVVRPVIGLCQHGLPEIGFLHRGSPEPSALMDAFSNWLNDSGISAEHAVRIEHRSAEGDYGRLPALAKDLVGRKVAVIAANFLPAALAAKAATQTIPIVFLSGSDPITSGLVSSFNHPRGNITGIAFMSTRLGPKNLELLHELLPKAPIVAVLMNPTNPNGASQVNELQAAARSLGLQLAVFGASTPTEIDDAFGQLAERDMP